MFSYRRERASSYFKFNGNNYRITRKPFKWPCNMCNLPVITCKDGFDLFRIPDESDFLSGAEAKFLDNEPIFLIHLCNACCGKYCFDEGNFEILEMVWTLDEFKES